MLWAHEQKGRPGIWAVSWTWAPFFLAADTDLIQNVDRIMTEKFRQESPDPEEVHREFIQMVLKRYPIAGLEQLLRSIEGVQLDRREHDVAGE